jgi:hypothetical protein
LRQALPRPEKIPMMLGPSLPLTYFYFFRVRWIRLFGGHNPVRT